MQFSYVLLVALALAAAAPAVVQAETEWVEPSFVETLQTSSLPVAGQACGTVRGSVCSAQAAWCGGRRAVPGLCANGAFCCTPVAAPAPADATRTLPAPGQPCGSVAGALCSARAEWCGQRQAVPGLCAGNAFCCTPRAPTPAAPVAPTPTPFSIDSLVAPLVRPEEAGLPVNDLSASEAAVDSAVEESPLEPAAAAVITAVEAQTKPVAAGPVVIQYEDIQPPQPTVFGANGAPIPIVRAPAAKKTIAGAGAVPTGVCGAYANSVVTKLGGNGGVIYDVVKILPQHAADRSMLSAVPTARDNTMRTATACAFDKMHNAAKKAGVNVLIASGFRTIARQNYFWSCYRTKKCNGGRLAARPGSSNHGRGIALDLNQSAPGVYRWLAANAHTFGFVRTVPSEKWHWEYRPGTPKARYT